MLHNVETKERHAEVDSAQDHSCHIGVAQTRGFEDGCAVIEEEVGSRQLLQGLECDAQEGSVSHSGPGEDLVPWLLTASYLFVVLLFDVSHLMVDFAVVPRHAVKFSHGRPSFFKATLPEGVTGRFREA